MALFNGSVYSHELKLDTQINVIFPDIPYDVVSDYKEPALLYLLHGLTDNATGWARLTQLEYFAMKYNFVVVMPEVHRSFYNNMKYGPNFFNYVADELPVLAGGIFNLPKGRKNTFIAGLSMGGYGAVKIGFNRPQNFAAIGCFSGGVDANNIVRMFMADDGKPGGSGDFGDVYSVFGDEYKQDLNDLHMMVPQMAKDPGRPRLLQTCGTEDFLYEDNRVFRTLLEKEGYGHTYREWAGAHEWPFWNKSIEMAMRFFRGEEI